MSFSEILETLLDVLLDALLDTAKLLPFLFFTYLLMEFLEHKAGEKVKSTVSRAGRVGPLAGAALGLLPQCGFSGAIAGLYAGRVVTVGTVLAVFLATSDELIAVALGEGVALTRLLTVLAVKFTVALCVGFAADLLLHRRRAEEHIVDLCEQEHCHCERGVWRSALHHTLHITLFVLLINLALGAALAFIGAERIGAWLGAVPVLSSLFAALVGLVPNCAASVFLATLWARGLLSGGAMLAGLLPGAGAGLLVLFRTNRHPKENLLLTAVIFATGVLLGTLFDVTGFAALLKL